MRFRTATAACTLAMLTPLPLAWTAQAQDDLDCADFESQEEAQQAFLQQPDDLFDLDRDRDMTACEALPSEPGAPSDGDETDDGEDAGEDAGEDDGAEPPSGPIDAGRGGAAGDPSDIAPALGIAVGLGLAAGGTVLVQRRRAAGDIADAED